MSATSTLKFDRQEILKGVEPALATLSEDVRDEARQGIALMLDLVEAINAAAQPARATLNALLTLYTMTARIARCEQGCADVLMTTALDLAREASQRRAREAEQMPASAAVH
jgi:hypothetical protein